MKKAIVTGATGAVGTALVNKLISENVETLVLVRKGGRVNKIPQNPLVKIAYCSLDEMADFQNKDNEKIIELMEQNVELNQLRTTLAKQIGDRIISPK